MTVLCLFSWGVARIDWESRARCGVECVHARSGKPSVKWCSYGHCQTSSFQPLLLLVFKIFSDSYREIPWLASLLPRSHYLYPLYRRSFISSGSISLSPRLYILEGRDVTETLSSHCQVHEHIVNVQSWAGSSLFTYTWVIHTEALTRYCLLSFHTG